MPTLNSVTKTARITQEDWIILEEIMETEGLTFSGLVHKLTQGISMGTPQQEDTGTPSKDVDISYISEEFEYMCELCGGTPESVMEDLCEKLNSGEILIEQGKLKAGEGYTPIDLSKFLEACSERDKDPQKMLNMATKSVWQI